MYFALPAVPKKSHAEKGTTKNERKKRTEIFLSSVKNPASIVRLYFVNNFDVLDTKMKTSSNEN